MEGLGVVPVTAIRLLTQALYSLSSDYRSSHWPFTEAQLCTSVQ